MLIWLPKLLLLSLALIAIIILNMVLEKKITKILVNSREKKIEKLMLNTRDANLIGASINSRLELQGLGWFGLLQPIADFAKLLTKGKLYGFTNTTICLVSLSLLINFGLYWIILYNPNLGLGMANYQLCKLLIFYLLGKCLLILTGLLINLPTTIKNAISMIKHFFAYSLPLAAVMFGVLVKTSSIDLEKIVTMQQSGILTWLCWPLFPLFFIYLIVTILCYNNSCFTSNSATDQLILTRSGSGGLNLALLYLVKHSNMLFLLVMASFIFLGGWGSPFNHIVWIPNSIWLLLKILLLQAIVIAGAFVWPKYQFEQILDLCWNKLFPLGLGWVVVLGVWLK